ncbi:hypothetical protein [Paenibacillus sp. D51F]
MQHGVHDTHYITEHLAMRLLLRSESGLIAEITDGVDYKYRGNLPYSLSKIWGILMAAGLAEEFKPYGICAVSLTPGILRSEEMLAPFGVTETNWRDAGEKEFSSVGNPALCRQGIGLSGGRPREGKLGRKASKLMGAVGTIRIPG